MDRVVLSVGSAKKSRTEVLTDRKNDIECAARWNEMFRTADRPQGFDRQRKMIFDPVPRVDGIDPSGDPLTDVRSEIYLLSGRRRRANGAI